MGSCPTGQSSEVGLCVRSTREQARTKRKTTQPNQPPTKQTNKRQKASQTPSAPCRMPRLGGKVLGGRAANGYAVERTRHSAVQLNPEHKRWLENEFGEQVTASKIELMTLLQVASARAVAPSLPANCTCAASPAAQGAPMVQLDYDCEEPRTARTQTVRPRPDMAPSVLWVKPL